MRITLVQSDLTAVSVVSLGAGPGVNKRVVDESSHRAWACLLPDTAQARIEAAMTYEECVRQTGWRWLPAGEPVRSVAGAS